MTWNLKADSAQSRLDNFRKLGLLNAEFFTLYRLHTLWIDQQAKLPISYRVLKRPIDFLLSITVLLVSAPLWFWVAIKIKTHSPGPILYRQLRLGQHGKPFVCYKFRTMHHQPGARNNKMPFEKETQPNAFHLMGPFLRESSIDELPQLLNVLKGEMSLVGPRPYPIDESLTITTNFAKRFCLRPGMTGIWQAYLGSFATHQCKLKLDSRYLSVASLSMDLYLITITMMRLFGKNPRKFSILSKKVRAKVERQKAA